MFIIGLIIIWFQNMSENQKLYEDFMRKFNLTTPLFAIDYIVTTIYPSSTEDVPTTVSLTEDGYTPPNNPLESILSADGAVEEFPWKAIVDAVLPTVALVLFYIFREICLIFYRIAKIKAKNPRIPFAQTLYYSVFATAILGKQLYI